MLLTYFLSQRLQRRFEAALKEAGLVTQVKKLSDRVLPKLVPALRLGMSSADAAHRQGVCLGLAEIISSAGRDAVTGYLEELISSVSSEQSVAMSTISLFSTETPTDLHLICCLATRCRAVAYYTTPPKAAPNHTAPRRITPRGPTPPRLI